MLLEVKCSVDQFNAFLSQAEEAGVRPNFDMHGADEISSFSLVTDHTEEEIEAEIEATFADAIDEQVASLD